MISNVVEVLKYDNYHSHPSAEGVLHSNVNYRLCNFLFSSCCLFEFHRQDHLTDFMLDG
jgi:hypothetical protein